jgi:hypothetical protein
MQRFREEKMGWKKYVYGLIGLYIIFDIVLVAMMKERGPIDPTSWESILSEFGLAAAMIFLGLDVVLASGDVLEWLRRHLHWSPPTASFRLFGCLFLLGGVLSLAFNVLDALIALGIVSSPYPS